MQKGIRLEQWPMVYSDCIKARIYLSLFLPMHFLVQSMLAFKTFCRHMHVNEKYIHTTIDEKCSIKTERHQWSTALFLVIKRVSKRYVNKQCFKRKQSENCVAQQMHCLFWIRWIDSKWSSACDQSVSLEKQRKKQHQYRPHFNEISCANIGFSRSQSIIHG